MYYKFISENFNFKSNTGFSLIAYDFFPKAANTAQREGGGPVT